MNKCLCLPRQAMFFRKLCIDDTKKYELFSVCHDKIYLDVICCTLIGQSLAGDITDYIKTNLLEKKFFLNRYQARKFSFIKQKIFWFKYGKKINNNAESLLSRNNFEQVQKSDLQLLLDGFLYPEIIFRLGKIAFKCFKFHASFHIFTFLEFCFPQWKVGSVQLEKGKCLQLFEGIEQARVVYEKAFQAYFVPIYALEQGYLRATCSLEGNPDWLYKQVYKQCANSKISSLRKAQCLIFVGDFDEARMYIQTLPFWKRKQCSSILTLAKTYLYHGDKDNARKILFESLPQKHRSTQLYNEQLRYCCFAGDRALGAALLDNMYNNKVRPNPFLAWVLQCGLGKLKLAFASHSLATDFHILDPYLKDTILTKLSEHDPFSTLVVVTDCCTGDELRFSRFYPLIAGRFPQSRIVFFCDYRMYALFCRSFPDLEFFPCEKAQSIAETSDINSFANLPEISCCRYLDNRAWDFVQREADEVITVMHALADVIEDYDQLKTLPRFAINKQQRAFFAEFFQSFRPRKLVGLSWRSIKQNMWRNLGSFAIEDLAPLFEMDGIQFINCQYGGLFENEKRWLDKNYPKKLLDVDDLNQKDDIDGTFAMYSCLDAMITATTYTIEVAGLVGIPTIGIARSCIPEMFTTPGTKHLAFLGDNTQLCCDFVKNGKPVIEKAQAALHKILVT